MNYWQGKVIWVSAAMQLCLLWPQGPLFFFLTKRTKSQVTSLCFLPHKAFALQSEAAPWAV
jgi:hypothetical protein